jgi:hypothetical protein
VCPQIEPPCKRGGGVKRRVGGDKLPNLCEDGETAARIQKTGSHLPTSYSGVDGMKAVDLPFGTCTATKRGAACYLVQLRLVVVVFGNKG